MRQSDLRNKREDFTFERIQRAKRDLAVRLELLDKTLRGKKIGILEHGDLLEAVWNLYSTKHVAKK